MERTLKELADLVGGRLHGDPKTAITGVNGIEEAGPGDITFLWNPRYASRLERCRASAVILGEGLPLPGLPAVVVADPNLAFTKVAGLFADGRPRRAGVHPTAVVGPNVALGKDVAVGPNCVLEEGASVGDGTVLEGLVYVGREAKIGRGCLLYPMVSVLERCVLGERVILHCGAVVGADGFGYVTTRGRHLKIPQHGIVVLEDDVELGANTTVDRPRIGRTLIRRGTKIDNLVQVAHSVEIGEDCLLVSQTGISGSAKLGKNVTLGGQSGVAGHLTIGEGSIVAAQAGVTKSLPPGSVVSGTPARPHRRRLRNEAALDRLSETLDDLRRRIEELESRGRSRPE